MAGKKTNKYRCSWAEKEIFHSYHDDEWGVPVHEDLVHFEFLTLEGAQAGLSWETILKKRENYRKAFDGFDYKKIARYDEKKVRSLLKDEGIVRNRLKIRSTIKNARAFLGIQKEFGSFDAYVWNFVNGKPVRNTVASAADIPSNSPLSDTISKDLKRRGFTFVGATIVYAFLQAIGIVNDHEQGCAWRQCGEMRKV